jgi:hypothetical protein
MKFTINEGIGTNGKPWTRSPAITEGPVENKLNQHPEDEFRTTEEILQDCKELEQENDKLMKHILRLS